MKMCLCCLKTTIAMQESESSFLAHFDIVIWVLFHCSFGDGMIFILFLEIVLGVLGFFLGLFFVVWGFFLRFG